jgi:hypothetical protein
MKRIDLFHSLEEQYISSTHTTNKSWSHEFNEGLRGSIAKGAGLIIRHGGSEMGFIPTVPLTLNDGSKEAD